MGIKSKAAAAILVLLLFFGSLWLREYFSTSVYLTMNSGKIPWLNWEFIYQHWQNIHAQRHRSSPKIHKATTYELHCCDYVFMLQYTSAAYSYQTIQSQLQMFKAIFLRSRLVDQLRLDLSLWTMFSELCVSFVCLYSQHFTIYHIKS